MCRFNILSLTYYQGGKKTQGCYDVIAVSWEHWYTKSDTQASLWHQSATKCNMMLERESCWSPGSGTARRAALNATSRLRVTTPSLQNFGKLEWNLWMHCFVFLVRCMQSWEQFYTDFSNLSWGFRDWRGSRSQQRDCRPLWSSPQSSRHTVLLPLKSNFKALYRSALPIHSSETHVHISLIRRVSPHFHSEVH